MAKTATISVRVDEEVKSQAEEIFHLLGLTSSQAISIFYKQVALQQGLPFAVRLSQGTGASSTPTDARFVRGKYSDVPASSEQFARHKQDEIALEASR